MSNACADFETRSSSEQALHAQHCARCAHEWRWQQSERELFRQREGAGEVAALWSQFESQQMKLKPNRISKELLLMAAAALVLFSFAALRNGTPSRSLSDQNSEENLMTQVLASYERPAQDTCSRLPSGLGFHCGPGIPASFIASRE